MSEALLTNDASKTELEKLQGIWKTVAVEVDGSPLASPLFEHARLVIAGNRFTLRNTLPDAEQTLKGVFRLDASKVPMEMNLVLEDGQTFEEIFERAGNTLRVCYPIKSGHRPTGFKTTPQSGLSLVIYERDLPVGEPKCP